MIATYKPLRVEIFDNTEHLTIEQVKAVTGCDLLFNGGLFNMSDFKPCCDIKDDGEWLNNDQWGYWGYGWNTGELPRVMTTADAMNVDNFLSCIWAIQDGEKVSLDNYASGIGGIRGRTAFGFKANGEIVILCVSDGFGALTLTGARDKLFEQGCVNGIILDGGGSSQGIFPNRSIYSKRIVSNYICVWIDKGEEMGKKYKVCLDPGHGANELNHSPDNSYYEYQFSFDMSQRVKRMLLETHAFDVLVTKGSAEQVMGLSERANKANAWGADVFISDHSNAIGNGIDWHDETHGLSVWIYKYGGNREILAKKLLEQYTKQGAELFGYQLYTGNFAVLRETNMPAVLIEHYFHTCHNDVKKLLDDKEREELAYAQACAICEYFGVDVGLVPIPTDDKPTGKVIYRVQVGAFTKKENAEAVAKELVKEGYSTIIKEEKR